MIKSLMTVGSDDSGFFIERVGKVVEEYQNNGLKVEIQYSTSVSERVLYYTALIIGRTNKEDKDV